MSRDTLSRAFPQARGVIVFSLASFRRGQCTPSCASPITLGTTAETTSWRCLRGSFSFGRVLR